MGFTLAAAAAMLYVGARLLVRAMSNRAVPELLLGGFFSLVALSVPAISQTATTAGMQLASAHRNLAFGHFGMSLAFGLLYAFTWRSFGPETSWRRTLALCGAIGLAGAWLAQVTLEGFQTANGIATLGSVFFRMLGVYWAFAEALVFYSRMRRRLRLGLADPVTTNRFLLWSIWTGLIATLMLAVLCLRVYLLNAGGDVDADAAVGVFRVFGAFGGIAASFALWLNFFPPEAYLRRLRGTTA